MLAMFYDRDGDGRFEECSRAGETFYDHNGDRLVDLTVRSVSSEHLIRWDLDFDGVLDRERTLLEGYVPEWGPERRIALPASRIFIDDRPRSTQPIAHSEVRYHFWELLLGLERH